MKKVEKKPNSAKNYTAIKAKFIEFLANPESKGTQGEFAKEHEVEQSTLSRWKNEPDFWDKVWIRFTDFYLQNQLPAINKKLIEKAKSGDKDAMDRVYKLAKRIKEETDQGLLKLQQYNFIFGMSEDELRKFIQAKLTRIGDSSGNAGASPETGES